MKKRQNIYFGQALAQLVDERAGDGKRSVSSVLNTVADRYRELVRRHTPELAADEWMAVFDALKDIRAVNNAALAVSSLPYLVSDALSLGDGLAEKWEIHPHDLVTKLEGLDWCHRLAVIDAAERFWSRDDWPGDNREELVRAVIGRMPA